MSFRQRNKTLANGRIWKFSDCYSRREADALQILLNKDPTADEIGEDEVQDELVVLEGALHAIPDAGNEEDEDNSDLADEVN